VMLRVLLYVNSQRVLIIVVEEDREVVFSGACFDVPMQLL